MHRTASFSVLLPFIFLCACAVSAQGQYPAFTPTPTPKPTPEQREYPCPNLAIQPLNPGQVRVGQPVGFVANINGGDPKVFPSIVWNTSAGTIIQGQGSRRIAVDSSSAADAPDRTIKADVWVGGYAPQCVLQASASVKVIPPAIKFGDFGELPDKKVSENLKALADYYSQLPNTDMLWIIVYSGRNSERGFAFTRGKKFKDELIADGVNSRRVAVIDGGYMEDPLFDFWIVPSGAQPPQPKPTIDRREILNSKPRVARP
jgi:hypothetical protein